MTDQQPVFGTDDEKKSGISGAIYYAYAFIDPKHVPSTLQNEYTAFKTLKKPTIISSGISLYYQIESFIAEHGNPDLITEITPSELRQQIQKAIPPSGEPAFDIIFEQEPLQRVHVYTIYITELALFISRGLGNGRLQAVLTAVTSVFPNLHVLIENGTFFMPPEKNTTAAVQSPDAFRQLYQELYNEIKDASGTTIANSIIQNQYRFIKQTYDYKITSYIFDIVPDGILENEQLLFTGRDTLEKQVQSRTKELEETKISLEQKVAERTRELADAKSRVETILTSIGDAVFAVDLKGNIILMNEIAEELTGYSLHEAMGKHYTQIFRFILEEEPNVPYGPFIETVIASGEKKTLSAHAQLVRRDGQRIAISDSAAPIQDINGTITGCVVVFRDFSRERELERAKDTFLSVAAHQLRTPLGSMRWNLEMLLSGDMGKLETQIHDTIEQIYDNDKRLIELVNDLLNVSRIDQKRTPFNPEPTDIIALTGHILKEIDPTARSRSVTIHFAYNAKDSYTLTLDKKRYIEAIENLLSNAIKYSNYGGNVEIEVKREKVGAVTIRISDHGIGIPEKDRVNMFTKFFRADNAIKSETEGTGLGLFVVKSYIESMGGSIDYTSTVGQGTTFIVELPDQ